MEMTGFWHMCRFCGVTEMCSLQEWRNPWTCKNCVLKYGDIELIDVLIQEQKKDYLSTKIWERFWQHEYAHPTTVGKSKALENIGLMQKHCETVQKRIDMYEDYRLHYKEYGEIDGERL